MNEAQSAVAYRNMIRATLGLTNPGDSDSLRNINTDPLPDGATCYVIENASIYRLDKQSTLIASASEIVAPAAGPGRWLQASTDAIGGAEPLFEFLQSPFSFATTGSPNWTEPATSDTSAFVGPSGLAWTLLTLAQTRYNGPQARYLITLAMSLQSSGIAETFDAGISVNADLAGGAVPVDAGVGTFRLVASPDVANITVQRMALLSPTQIVQPRLKGPGGVVNASVLSMTLTARAVG